MYILHVHLYLRTCTCTCTWTSTSTPTSTLLYIYIYIYIYMDMDMLKLFISTAVSGSWKSQRLVTASISWEFSTLVFLSHTSSRVDTKVVFSISRNTKLIRNFVTNISQNFAKFRENYRRNFAKYILAKLSVQKMLQNLAKFTTKNYERS
jgi:hypothetical protein